MLPIKKSLDSFLVTNAKDNILKTSSLQNFNEIESITLQFINTQSVNDDVFFMYNSALILLTESTPFFITSTKDKGGKIIGTKVILRNFQKDYFLYRLKVEILPRLSLKVKPKISGSSLTFHINPLFFEEINELYDFYSNLPQLKVSLNGTNFSILN